MKLYRRFSKYIEHNLNYIDDFFNISTFRQGISTYRQLTTKFAHYFKDSTYRSNTIRCFVISASLPRSTSYSVSTLCGTITFPPSSITSGEIISFSQCLLEADISPGIVKFGNEYKRNILCS